MYLDGGTKPTVTAKNEKPNHVVTKPKPEDKKDSKKPGIFFFRFNLNDSCNNTYNLMRLPFIKHHYIIYILIIFNNFIINKKFIRKTQS